MWMRGIHGNHNELYEAKKNYLYKGEAKRENINGLFASRVGGKFVKGVDTKKI